MGDADWLAGRPATACQYPRFNEHDTLHLDRIWFLFFFLFFFFNLANYADAHYVLVRSYLLARF